MPPESKRRLLYNKRISPHTFVFFFHKGPSETSWSVRDYSTPGSVAVRNASEYRDAAGRIPSASEIRASAEFDVAAPAHPTTDLAHWHAAVAAKNAEYLGEHLAGPPATIPIRPIQPADAAPSFPIPNLPKLIASPKARKRGDIERILHSENSEDYVTWNFFQLLEAVPVSCWWPMLLKMTGLNSIDPADSPAVRLWQTVAVPQAYEALSRERMRTSESLARRERSLEANPVEGPSEID